MYGLHYAAQMSHTLHRPHRPGPKTKNNKYLLYSIKHNHANSTLNRNIILLKIVEWDNQSREYVFRKPSLHRITNSWLYFYTAPQWRNCETALN